MSANGDPSVISRAPGWPGTGFAALGAARHPIIAAPMAGAAGVELAIAAIMGGAVGSLPCATLSLDEVRKQAEAVRDATAREDGGAIGPLNLNFFCHTMPDSGEDSAWRALLKPYYAEYGVTAGQAGTVLRRPFGTAMCAVVEDMRPDIVSFHFGLPAQSLVDRLRRAGVKVIASATSIAEARFLARRGVDGVIAQGFEAGGHIGRFLPADPGTEMGLMALLPQIVDAVEVPVIAAGGIMDGRGIVAALALGAAGVQLGSAYLHCPESRISAAHRAAIAGEGAEATRFTSLFSGTPARGVPNRLMKELGATHRAVPPFPYASGALAPLRAAAEALGEGSFSPLWAGQAARIGRAIPARELTGTLAREALDLMARLGRMGTAEQEDGGDEGV